MYGGKRASGRADSLYFRYPLMKFDLDPNEDPILSAQVMAIAQYLFKASDTLLTVARYVHAGAPASVFVN